MNPGVLSVRNNRVVFVAMALAVARRHRGLSEHRPARRPRVHDQGSADHHAVSRRERRRSRQGSHQPDRNRLPAAGAARRASSPSRRAACRSSRRSSRTATTRTASRRCGTSCAARSPTSSRSCRRRSAARSMVVDDFGDVYGIFLAITGDGYSFPELRRYAEFLRRELLLVPDVKKRRAVRRAAGSRVPGNLAAAAGAARHQRRANLRQAAGARTSPPTAAACASARSTSRSIRKARFGSVDDMLELVIGSDKIGPPALPAGRGDARARRSGPAAAAAALRRQAGHRPRHLDRAGRQRRDDGRRRPPQARASSSATSRSASRSARSTSSPRRSPTATERVHVQPGQGGHDRVRRAAVRDGPQDGHHHRHGAVPHDHGDVLRHVSARATS